MKIISFSFSSFLLRLLSMQDISFECTWLRYEVGLVLLPWFSFRPFSFFLSFLFIISFPPLLDTVFWRFRALDSFFRLTRLANWFIGPVYLCILMFLWLALQIAFLCLHFYDVNSLQVLYGLKFQSLLLNVNFKFKLRMLFQIVHELFACFIIRLWFIFRNNWFQFKTFGIYPSSFT